MRWEYLTYYDIQNINKEKTVVIIPVGSLEVHGPHLPLGTDALSIHRISLDAAEKTGSLVLPPLFYAYVPENRHFCGTITLTGNTFLKVLEEICDEIYRNGFKKILIVNGHGGNTRPLNLFLREMVAKGKKYELYILSKPWILIEDLIEEIAETKIYGHACEIETSYMMYLFPELCKLERVEKEAELGIEKIVEKIDAMTDWIGYALEGYVGDPRKATVEKGRKLYEKWVEGLVNIIEEIKKIKNYDDIMRRYYERIQHT